MTDLTLFTAEEDPKSPSMVTWATRTPTDAQRSRTPCTTGTFSPPTSWPTRRSSQSAQCARPYSSHPSAGKTSGYSRVLKESFKTRVRKMTRRPPGALIILPAMSDRFCDAELSNIHIMGKKLWLDQSLGSPLIFIFIFYFSWWVIQTLVHVYKQLDSLLSIDLAIET